MKAGSQAAADDPAARRAAAVLTVDLAAIQANYRRLQAELGQVECAAVVKADAYGLGAARVAPALAAAGARRFFVALLDEAIALRGILAETCPEATIGVLAGLMPGAEADYLAHRIMPVLNRPEEVERWRALAGREDRRLTAALHVDTGMNRLGLSPGELDDLAAAPARLDGIDLVLCMSHLACAEEPDNPLNAQQLEAFEAARRRLPTAKGSLANSSGIFLGPAYHFELARPGAALYGINPIPDRPTPMAQVIRLQGRILQVREIDAPGTVGYGATHRVPGGSRVATVAVGYADGYLRSLSGRSSAWIDGQEVPVIGRVSMDLITLDVSAVPAESVRPGDFADLIGPNRDVDTLARSAGTIGYEILTALGARYHRVYLGG